MAQTLTISWGAPIQNDGSQQVTSYTLSYKKSTDSTYTKITGVTSPYVLSGLLGATNYDVCVQSNCSSCISEVLCTTAITNSDITPTPTSTSTPTPTPTSTSTPTPTPTMTATPTPTPTATPQPLYNVYEICGWTDTASQYKYILYSNTYGTRGFIDVTYCASQVSDIGGITLSAVNTAYPLAMPAGSFTTDPISCGVCS